ncbi:hypothetical protein M404DRAFT_995297 [Pisolithus tinctorius Marx 270]|uniref:Uncharacterized protein n=1 Tax=Pisolithus tinctorius Marx 270 TaxID=870435 RepID=A0A0C3KMN7_PISTI|nr:hypothetical protein M404DRAFT_995297 [Pisolithus tinctorius Marx 270]
MVRWHLHGINVYTNHETGRQPVIPDSYQETSLSQEAPMLSELSDQTTIPQVMARLRQLAPVH